MVKISIILPVYNMERYLSECMESIINQTFSDFEVICIDDGSTDSSPEILKDYKDKDSRVRIITQENMGLSCARNAGMDEAAGEYIYFIDSDDYINPNALETMVNLCERHDLDLLIFKLVNFDDKTGEENPHYSDMPFLLDLGDAFTYRDFDDYLFKVDVTVSTKFFKRQLIINRRFPEGLIFEDNAFIFDYIFDAQRIFFLDECLYHRRVREGSIITLASKNHCDLIEIYRIIEDKFKSRGIYEEYRERLFMRKIDSIYYRFTTIDSKFKAEYFDLMKRDFENQKNEFDRDFNLDKIDQRIRTIFNAVIQSDNPSQIKANMKAKKTDSKIAKMLRIFKRR